MPIPKVLSVLPLPPRSGPSHSRRAPSPSPLHFRWHSSNVPGLGRQPQAPSSPVPPALAAAVPGVRSEPRPVPAPAPRPPPSGGSVKPGGEGGGEGSPTRGGAGGGGGPAGGELAAKTFPMVACKGKGQRAEVKAHGLQALSPANTPLLVTPVLTRGSASSRSGLRSHPVRHAQPNPLPPPPPPSPRPPQSIGLTGPCVRPPASGSGLTIGVVDESSTHFLGTSFSVGSHSQTGQSTPPRPSHWLGEPTPIGSRCRGFRCSPAIGLCCLLCNALLTYRLRPFPEVTPPHTFDSAPRRSCHVYWSALVLDAS